jgi:hypothetical protein
MKSRRWATEEEISQLGRTQEARTCTGCAISGAAATGAALHFVAANLKQRLRGELAAVAPGGWSEFGALNSRGVSNPPMLGARYVWPFLKI